MAVKQRADGPVKGADDNEDEPDSGSSASDAEGSGSASWMQHIFGALFFQRLVPNNIWNGCLVG